MGSMLWFSCWIIDIWLDPSYACTGPCCPCAGRPEGLPCAFPADFPNDWVVCPETSIYIGAKPSLSVILFEKSGHSGVRAALQRVSNSAVSGWEGVDHVTAAEATRLRCSETFWLENILPGFRPYILNFGLEIEAQAMSAHISLTFIICITGLWYHTSTLAKKGENWEENFS